MLFRSRIRVREASRVVGAELAGRVGTGQHAEQSTVDRHLQRTIRTVGAVRGVRARVVRRLAIDTDPDVSARIALLEEEIESIERRIESLRSGDESAIDEDRALERVRDVLSQAADVPDDFARVRAEFEALNASLRAKIVESDVSQASVVDEVFRGIDHISDSDAGRSFAAFSQLVLDPALEIGRAHV